MTRKRRTFDIDLPDGDLPDVTPEPAAGPAPAVGRAPEVKSAVSAGRRGPIATAINENSEALRSRRDAEAAIRAENDALAHEFVAMREAGQVVQMVPLDDVHMYLLTRDRMPGIDYELPELVQSIRDVGLSNPIRVLPRPDGDGYELVQGYRRLSAYRELLDKDGEDWAQIPALILPGAPDIAGLYRRMVDENMIRKDLSFAEMAMTAQNYAADPATKAEDVAEAVAELFESAPYSKRSYIRSFAYLLDRVGPYLQFAPEIPRALGIALAREVKARPEIVPQIAADLDGWDNRSVRDELDVLQRYARSDVGEGDPFDAPPKPAAPTGQGSRTKTTFHLESRAGQVKCTAAQGRLEIKVDRDFGSIDRGQLERAVAALIDGLA